ncbi:MAG: hypothetical protein LQ342_000128 [Letrouitia transgressa]|nr:MAG: hypothetical protein LQ342_000128 [Letrouitia transgressa]
MDSQQAIAHLMELTAITQANATTLVATYGTDDLESALLEARDKKMISPEAASVARMALLTNLTRDRCQHVIDSTRDKATAEVDLYAAIRMVEAYHEVPPIVTRPALLAVLMRVNSDLAQQYLNETETDPQSVQRAILYIKAAQQNSSNATMALMRLYTSLPESTASRYLTGAGAQGLEVAIKLACEAGHIGKIQALVARLQARFEIDEEEAKHYAIDLDVKGDYSRATQQVIIDRFMVETCLDRQDASSYLNKTKYDIDAARHLFREDLCQTTIIDAENGDTRHPPDVHPNTHVIAVLGVTDGNNNASPSDDGWMVSD